MNQDQFEIIRSLGVGATAEVFKARELKSDRFVALKCFSQVISHDDEALLRLKSEVNILSTLQHPNIVKLYGQHQFDQHFCLELELIEGGHLRDWMKADRLKVFEHRLWILVQVARGLGAAHEYGIIHRDLKPENILISNDGDVKLSDFGLAKELGRLTMTRMGLLVGSLGYMAPELVDGQKASTSADLFSFGTIAYELLAGRPAFSGDSPQMLLKSIVDNQVEPLTKICPYIPQRISQLIEKCLAKSPDERPESIWQIEAEIMSYLAETRMVPFCQLLVSKNANGADVKKALQVKHQALIVRKEKLVSDPCATAGEIINLANEFQLLFPDDQSGLELLAAIHGREAKKRTNRQYIFAAILTVVFFVGLGIFWQQSEWFKTTEEKVIEVAKVKYEEKYETNPRKIESARNSGPQYKPVDEATDNVVKSFEKKAAPAPKPEKKIVAKTPAKPKRGTLQFFVDEGVAVFVNERRVPYEDLNNFTVEAGKHQIKLVKPGFLPLENSVQVRAGRVTQVRAKGGQ